MLHWIIIALVIGAFFKWLFEDVSSEKSFTINSTVSRRVIFDFMKAPINLERTHPHIIKISHIETDSDTVTFNMLEDLGFMGRKRFPVKLVSYSDASHFTSHIQIETNNSFAQVTVVLDISDYDAGAAKSREDQSSSEVLPSVTIRGVTKVKSSRALNFLISGHVLGVWEQTTMKTIDLLGGETDNKDHKKSS